VAAGLALLALGLADCGDDGGGGGSSGGQVIEFGQGGGSRAAERAANGANADIAKPLSETELLARADAICLDSRQRYAAIEAPVTDAAAAQQQAAALAEVAGSSAKELDSLQPPPALDAAYEDYVRGRFLMRTYLIEARDAAAVGDLAGFEAAKDKIDAEQPTRYEAARAVGLYECSRRR
jgi:hypothetical protein